MLSTQALLFALSYVLLITAAFKIQAYVRRKSFARQNGCGEPQELDQESIFGFRMLRDSYNAFRNASYLRLTQERFDNTGTTFSYAQLGGTSILTIDPVNVKAILSDKIQDFGVGPRRAEAFSPLIGHGILTADGPEWEAARKLLRPSFARGKFDSVDMFESHWQNLLICITAAPADEPLDLQPLFQGLTLDVSTEFLFGESTKVLSSKEAADAGRAFFEAFDRGQKSVIAAFAVGKVAWLDPTSKFQKDRQTVHDYTAKFIHQALDEKSSEDKDARTGLLQDLVKETRDSKALAGGLLHLLLAGRDTTASLLSNLFFVLCREPAIWKRLVEEVRSTISSEEPPTIDDLRSMKYLRACLNESLRLHPPIPRNSREALRDTVLPTGGGPDGTEPILVTKGAQVGYQVWAMHRRKDVFGEDAETFRPERWNEGLRPGWAFLPFNGGPRICVGQQFALNLASYTVCRMAMLFDNIECCDSTLTWEEGLGIACTSKNGTRVKLVRRT